MENFIILFLVIGFVLMLIKPSTSKTGTQTINVTTNYLDVPENLQCSCGNHIDTLTCLDHTNFDLVCDVCGKTAWENPKRDDRISFINDMLDA